jgi:hypothetical protein
MAAVMVDRWRVRALLRVLRTGPDFTYLLLRTAVTALRTETPYRRDPALRASGMLINSRVHQPKA